MADETTSVPAGDSDPIKQSGVNPPQPTPAANANPEPVILEERIIVPATQPSSTIPKPVQPPVVPPPKIAPIPVPPPRPVSAPIPPVPPVPSAVRTTHEPAPNDISHILETIKLPERREFQAAADTSRTKIPVPDMTLLEDTATSGVGASAPASASSKISTPPENSESAAEHSSSAVVPLRTLKDDMQEVVRERKISLVSAVALEEDKKRGRDLIAPEQKEIRAHRSKRMFGIMFAAGILLFLGAAALLGVFFVMSERQAVPPAVTDSSIMFSESEVTFSLDNQTPQNLKSELAQAEMKPLGALGSITRVVPTITATDTSGTAVVAPATIAEFFSALGIQPPQELMGAIGPDFFFGFHVVDTNAPLFVIPVTSYDHAFAGMLSWEPNMNADLSPIFTVVPATTMGPNGIPEMRTFQDSILRNYDVRELEDDSGNVVLYYSFPTPNILVIAESPYSFTEILSRLQAAREL